MRLGPCLLGPRWLAHSNEIPWLILAVGKGSPRKIMIWINVVPSKNTGICAFLRYYEVDHWSASSCALSVFVSIFVVVHCLVHSLWRISCGALPVVPTFSVPHCLRCISCDTFSVVHFLLCIFDRAFSVMHYPVIFCEEILMAHLLWCIVCVAFPGVLSGGAFFFIHCL